MVNYCYNLLFSILLSCSLVRNHCSAFLSSPTPRAFSFPSINQAKRAKPLILFYTNSTVGDDNRHVDDTLLRFQREAANKKEIDEECILTIHGNQYNMTAWANAHPGTKSSFREYAKK